MRTKIRKLPICICIILSLLFSGVYANETADLIEYDTVYTVTTANNITSLNAVFTITNNETESKTPLLLLVIYDTGKIIKIKTAEPTIASGSTGTESISVAIPEDKTEKYYVKLYAWEDSESLKPLGDDKIISDIDPYLREKLIYVTSQEDTEFKIFMNASTVKGSNIDAVHTIEYDSTKISPVDLCGFTYEKELSATDIPNTNILINSVDAENGIIKYKFLNDSGRNTGINNYIIFKALTSVTDTEIKYTIQ